MIVLKSTFDELSGKFAALTKENETLKAELESRKTDPAGADKLKEMESSVLLSVETVKKLEEERDTLTKQVSELNSTVEKMKADQVAVEVRAQQITATAGTTPVAMTEEDVKPKANLLSQLAQIRNAKEQRAFWEANAKELTAELLEQKNK